MNRAQIDRLLSRLPADFDARHRRRVDAYAATARRCEIRIGALRSEIQRALDEVPGVPAGADEDAAADAVLRLACELDALERVQSRIDAWVRVAVGAVSDDPGPEPFGEGPA